MREIVKSKVNKFRVRTGAAGTNDDIGNYGAFLVQSKNHLVQLAVICADGDNEYGWEHVSLHAIEIKKGKRIERIPTWEEMCEVKDLFFEEDETVIQFHPAKEEYVNDNPYVLHLWRQAGINHPLPPNILI